MIAKTYIQQDLCKIEILYKQSKTQKNSLFYSKLAIIELGGWVEMSMDDIILKCAKRSLKVHKNFEHVEKEIVKKNFGFEYEKNFRKMLAQLIGLVNVEKMECQIDQVKFQKMRAELGTLKIMRNSEAHTHIKGTTKHIDAPSITINRFYSIYDGLWEIDRNLRNCKF